MKPNEGNYRNKKLGEIGRYNKNYRLNCGGKEITPTFRTRLNQATQLNFMSVIPEKERKTDERLHRDY